MKNILDGFPNLVEYLFSGVEKNGPKIFQEIWQNPASARDGNLRVVGMVIVGQELYQQASWLLIGCTRVNNQSEARSEN